MPCNRSRINFLVISWFLKKDGGKVRTHLSDHTLFEPQVATAALTFWTREGLQRQFPQA
jgi:hypothetical protein